MYFKVIQKAHFNLFIEFCTVSTCIGKVFLPNPEECYNNVLKMHKHIFIVYLSIKDKNYWRFIVIQSITVHYSINFCSTFRFSALISFDFDANLFLLLFRLVLIGTNNRKTKIAEDESFLSENRFVF